MKQVKIKSMEYFCREYNKTSKREGILITFVREDESEYKKEISFGSSIYDIQSISENLWNKFVLELLSIYRIFVSSDTPEIKADSTKEFCEKYISLYEADK